MKKNILTIALVLVFFAALPSIARSLYEPPVLMYHRVGSPDNNHGLFVTPENFHRQMEFLKAHRMEVIPLAELIRKMKAQEPIPMNSVVITFDDGYLDNFKNAFPVLKKMGFPATIFMISGNIGKEDWLSEEDLRILGGSDIAIGSHTVTHQFLPELLLAQAQKEIVDSKRQLEEILGHPVTLFSYPAGGMTFPINRAVENAGFEGAVTTNYVSRPLDPYAIHRVKISDARGNLFNFWLKTTGFYHLGKKRVKAKYGND